MNDRERKPDTPDGEQRDGRFERRDSRENRGDRPADREHRFEKREGDRPERRDSRPAGRFGGDRPAGRFGGDRPAGRPENREGRDSRPAGRFGGDRPAGDRPSGRFEKREGSDRDSRPSGRFEKREGGFEGRGRFERGPSNRDLDAVKDVDAEILRLVVRRARLVAKLRSAGPKGRMEAGLEKSLRASWEEKAARFGRDSRLAHDLFALLQALEAPRMEEDQPAFQLAPSKKPVNIRMPAPADTVTARSWLALAAASGTEMKLERVPLTDAVVEGVKAVNSLGGQLWWEENGDILNRGGKGLTRGIDKVVHAGDDAFNLWLLLAFSLGWQSRLKIAGGTDLQLTDLSPLSHFLPLMGARLTNVVPGRSGLPIRLECSGVLPEGIPLPSDLPPGFVHALLLAAPFWDQPITFSNCPDSPALDILRRAGVSFTAEQGRVAIRPGAPACAASFVPMDAEIAAYILAFPAMAGGEARLDGLKPESPTARLAERLLRNAGLTLETAETHIAAHLPENAVPEAPDAELLDAVRAQAPGLFPLAAVLAALAMRKGKEAILPLPGENPDDPLHALPGFLAQLSLAQDEAGRIIALPATDSMAYVWIAPSAPWVAALALGAFLRPAIRLANPGLTADWLPSFWVLYNSLPVPDFSPKPPVEEPADVKPTRRRLIARDVFVELPPEPPSGDGF